jgi:hypothetical protein
VNTYRVSYMIQTGSKVTMGDYKVVSGDTEGAAGAISDFPTDGGADHVAIVSVEAIALGELF